MKLIPYNVITVLKIKDIRSQNNQESYHLLWLCIKHTSSKTFLVANANLTGSFSDIKNL